MDTQDQGGLLLVLADSDREHLAKIRPWALICSLMNPEFLKLNTQLTLKFQNKSLHLILFQPEATGKVTHNLFSVFPSTSFQHVPWKNWEKWNHFCEGPGWTQSQHYAQYIPFSVSSRVHNSRCGCKCNALRWRLDWEVEGNEFFPILFPSFL